MEKEEGRKRKGRKKKRLHPNQLESQCGKIGIFFFISCVQVFYLHVCLQTICANPQRPERARVIDGCEPLCWWWVPNSSFPLGQQILLPLSHLPSPTKHQILIKTLSHARVALIKIKQDGTGSVTMEPPFLLSHSVLGSPPPPLGGRVGHLFLPTHLIKFLSFLKAYTTALALLTSLTYQNQN